MVKKMNSWLIILVFLSYTKQVTSTYSELTIKVHFKLRSPTKEKNLAVGFPHSNYQMSSYIFYFNLILILEICVFLYKYVFLRMKNLMNVKIM